MKFWIHDPHCDQAPVSFWRWLQWRVGVAFERIGHRLKWRGIDPNDEIEIPF